jgi:putative SOS response-associated peptidase YedK
VEDPGPDLLVPGTPGVLDAWPVSKAVGNVRNNGPELVEPQDPQEEAQLF